MSNEALRKITFALNNITPCDKDFAKFMNLLLEQ